MIRLKGLGKRSINTNLGRAGQLADHYPEASLQDLDSRQVLGFLSHLQTGRKLFDFSLNQAVCALRTFYRDHLGNSWKIWAKIRIHREELFCLLGTCDREPAPSTVCPPQGNAKK